MSGDLHHLSDGIRVGTSHSADVKFGETLFLHLFKKTKHAAVKEEEERHSVSLTDSCECLLAHTPRRSSSGRCYSGGLCGRLSLRFPGRCSADSSWQTFYPVEQHTHRRTVIRRSDRRVERQTGRQTDLRVEGSSCVEEQFTDLVHPVCVTGRVLQTGEELAAHSHSSVQTSGHITCGHSSVY